MTFQYKGGTVEELFASPADWISPDCSRGYKPDPPAASGAKVMIIDTDHGYGWQALKKDGARVQQAWVWKNLLRGNQTLFMDPYLAKIAGGNTGRNSPGGANPREPYFGLSPDPYWETIRVAMGRARRYAEKIDLAAAAPRSEVSSTAYCLANPGSEYLVYNPGEPKSFTVSLNGGGYEFEWYNPTTGTRAVPLHDNFAAWHCGHQPDAGLGRRRQSSGAGRLGCGCSHRRQCRDRRRGTDDGRGGRRSDGAVLGGEDRQALRLERQRLGSQRPHDRLPQEQRDQQP